MKIKNQKALVDSISGSIFDTMVAHSEKNGARYRCLFTTKAIVMEFGPHDKIVFFVIPHPCS